MITRYAIFEGVIRDGQTEAMHTFVNERLVPLWRQFACAETVRVMFGVEQDPNGTTIPMILAISYADEAAMKAALDSPARYTSRDLLPELYDTYFEEVKLYHYVMDTQVFPN